MRIREGMRLGSYEVDACIGVGGMGELYRARDDKLRRYVAIKVLSETLAADASARSRFEREARIVAALSHPNILGIHELGEAGDITYAVTEFLEGETLADLLARGRLPTAKAVMFARQIARGLAAAHDKGVVHRDLKPHNVFVTNDGHVKILDFGVAQLIERPRPTRRPRSRSEHFRARCWARSLTCRRSRCAGRRWTSDPISSPSARCSTRC